MRRLCAQVYERICIASLLTVKGKKNARVVGATGINDHTGKLYVFKATLILVMPAKQRIRTIWKRKSTGEEFRMGMLNPPPPNEAPHLGNRD